MVSGRNKLFLALREHWKPQNIKKDLPEYGETAIKINGKRKPYTCRGESPNPALLYYTHVRESKTVSLGFWITRHGFPALDSGFFDSETWIPDLNHKWDSGFLELYSRFQSPGFRIPQFKLSDSRFHEQKTSRIALITVHGANYTIQENLWMFALTWASSALQNHDRTTTSIQITLLIHPPFTDRFRSPYLKQLHFLGIQPAQTLR